MLGVLITIASLLLVQIFVTLSILGGQMNIRQYLSNISKQMEEFGDE